MRLAEAACRRRMAAARVAYLATAGADGQPHVVPIVFAVRDGELYFAVDQKPKSTTRLKRLRNLTDNPRVAVLAEHYADDWSSLWWVRADGRARIVTDDAERAATVALLGRRYPQYVADPPSGPVVAIRVERWSGWAA